MKKYVLTETTKEYLGVTLYQIKAIRAFDNVEEGELGGWVESEENLDHDGNAWVYGDAQVESRKHIFWASSVGSENGTLTAYTTKNGQIGVTRGCFRGTLDEFEAAVKERHNNTHYADEYLALIQYIRLRFASPGVTNKCNQ